MTAGEQRVEMLGENREVAVGVVDASVIVVGHGNDEEDIDLGAPGGKREAVSEGVVGFVVWV